MGAKHRQFVVIYEDRSGGEIFSYSADGEVPAIGDELSIPPEARERLLEGVEMSRKRTGAELPRPSGWPFEYWKVRNRTFDLATGEIALSVWPIPTEEVQS